MTGLTAALVLSKHKNLNITVVSKHMPGDYDIEYASPWAGANFMPVGKEGSKLRAFERATWPEIDRICRELPEAGIHYQECRVYGRKKDEGTAVGVWFEELVKKDPWFKDLMPEVSPQASAIPFYHSDTTPREESQITFHVSYLLLFQETRPCCTVTHP